MMHTASSFVSFVAIVSVLPHASAWGTLGHETVAYIAQNFVASSTASWCQSILADTSSSYLANYATWADSYRYTSAGKFSAPFHFIDANDSPPSSCSVNYDRDCGATGCVVSAIQNYTQRVQDGRLSQAHQQEALKFIIHFLGDVTQPLHDEALEVGGNDIAVTFDGVQTNLHHIWDTDMLMHLRGLPTTGTPALSDAQSWANDLTNEINSGMYSSAKDSWLSSSDISDSQSSGVAWATDANSQVCSTVLKGGEASVENHELNGSYYQAAYPVFQEQIAKAGYRLAAWLDDIAAAN